MTAVVVAAGFVVLVLVVWVLGPTDSPTTGSEPTPIAGRLCPTAADVAALQADPTSRPPVDLPVPRPGQTPTPPQVRLAVGDVAFVGGPDGAIAAVARIGEFRSCPSLPGFQPDFGRYVLATGEIRVLEDGILGVYGPDFSWAIGTAELQSPSHTGLRSELFGLPGFDPFIELEPRAGLSRASLIGFDWPDDGSRVSISLVSGRGGAPALATWIVE